MEAQGAPLAAACAAGSVLPQYHAAPAMPAGTSGAAQPSTRMLMAAQRFRGRRGAGGTSEQPGGNGGKKPPGGSKHHGAVLFSRKKRLIEASARTGAPLPPASRIHPRLPAADPPNTHPSCAGSQRQAEHGGASPRATRSPRRSSPVPHGLFGSIYHTEHRSLASQPREDFIPPLAPASSSHTHTGHIIPGLGDGSARVPTARTRRSAARQTDG